MNTVEDIEKQQRAERQQIRSDAELLKQLVAHKGWPRYLALIERVAQNHYANVMKPVDNLLESTRVEYAKGILGGLTAATSLPAMKIREAQELTKTSPGAEEAEDE
jgi:hypothetical protein